MIFLNSFCGLPFGQMSVQGMHILMRFSSTSILLLGHALTQELWSTTKLSGKQFTLNAKCRWLLFITQEHTVQVTLCRQLKVLKVTFIHRCALDFT